MPGRMGYAEVMPWKRVLLAGIAGIVVLGAAGLPGSPPSPAAGAAWAAEFATGPLIVITPRGRFPFTVEMALTAEQRSQGLQFRRFLAADAGMLFDFGETAPVAMWMLNTPIPLDMVFVDAAGWVVRVVENTTPHSLDVISSEEPVRGVLEVAAGTAGRLAIRKGSRIEHPRFGGG